MLFYFTEAPENDAEHSKNIRPPNLFQKSRKIHRKAPVSESLFLISCLKPETLLKKRLRHKVFPVSFCETFKNTFFKYKLQATAPENKC